MSESSHKLSLVQRIFTLVLFPFAASIERHSRSWIIYPACGHKASVWERGGIRWYAKGRPKYYGQCPECGKNSWHQVYKEDSLLEKS